MTDWIELSPSPLSVTAAVDFATDPTAGGIDIFLGTTRSEKNSACQDLMALDYEAYPEMAITQMRDLADPQARPPAPYRPSRARRAVRHHRRFHRSPRGVVRGLPLVDRHAEGGGGGMEEGGVGGRVHFMGSRQPDRSGPLFDLEMGRDGTKWDES